MTGFGSPKTKPSTPSIPQKPPQAAPLPPSSKILRGLDVSHWQDPLDWNAAKALGYTFAFAKASDGETGKDDMFAKHKAGAKTAGLIFGAYHFFRFGADPAKQMANFIAAAGTVESGELPHTIDVEWDKTSAKYGEGKMMDEDASEDVWVAASILAHSIGMAPMIYTNPYFWVPGKRSSTWQSCLLWVPAYHTVASSVKIPAPWAKMNFWQDSEHLTMGKITDIDTNQFFGTMDDLKALTKK